MKIDRLIGIITMLLQQDKTTAPELAERFEVSRRTINRDIEDICKAGIPLVTTQGYGGGISIAEGYKLDKSLLDSDELQLVIAAAKGIDSVSQSSCLAKLSDKLSGRDGHAATEEIIIIDLASHYQLPLTAKIDTIKNAVRERKTVSFNYYYEKGEQRRRVEPYRLVFKWSAWYLFGYCLDREAFRLFKLNRLWDLEPSGEHFVAREIPAAELEFGDYMQEGKYHLKASFAASEKHRLIDEYSINCYTVDEGGRLLLERDFASYDNLREWVFSFGDRVEVLEPQELREDRRRQARNILNM